jgi:hypothetical protein
MPSMTNMVDGDKGDNESGYIYNSHANDDDAGRVFVL